MKPCDPRWREELLDHAAGSPASAVLAGHLDNCPACSSALKSMQTQMAKVDVGVQQLAQADPPLNSVPQILSHVRESRKQVWFSAREWGTAGAGALLIVVAIFGYGWRLREKQNEEYKLLAAASSVSSWKSPTNNLLRYPADRWLKASPELGNYFYKLETTVPAKEKANP